MHFHLSYLQAVLMKEEERCAKSLKDEIPRQLFEIPIQAAIGSKIIARETVKCNAQGCPCKMLRW